MPSSMLRLLCLSVLSTSCRCLTKEAWKKLRERRETLLNASIAPSYCTENATEELQRAQVVAPSSLLQIAVLQHTHTLLSLPGIRVARQQLSQWFHPRIKFEHHVALWSSDGRCEQLLEGVRQHVDNVRSCVNTTALAYSYAGLADSINTFWRTGHRANFNSFTDKGFAYNNCDAAVIWWYDQVLTQSQKEQYGYFWLMEWDVVWTGDLAMLLASFHGVPPSPSVCSKNGCAPVREDEWKPLSQDILCTDGPIEPRNTRIRGYAHIHTRNMTTFRQHECLRYCVPALQRVTGRVLAAVAKRTRQSAWSIYCEMRAPTVCLSDIRGCTFANMRELASQGRFFNHNSSGNRLFTWDLVISNDTFSAVEREQRVGFFHRYKWASVPPGFQIP